MRRISPLGKLICAQSDSRAISVAPVPALRQSRAPSPGEHLDIVNLHTDRHPSQRHAIADGGGASGPFFHRLADLQAIGSDDIPLLAVNVNSKATRALRFGSY